MHALSVAQGAGAVIVEARMPNAKRRLPTFPALQPSSSTIAL